MPDDIETKQGAPFERFGLRLWIAIALRFMTPGTFLKRLRSENIASKSTLYNHLSGANAAGKKVVLEYERLLSLPKGWLADDSVSLDDLREASTAISAGNRDHPALLRLAEQLNQAAAPASIAVLYPINHPAQHSGTDSSIISQIRHIPILSDDKTSAWLAGERSLAMLTAQTLAIPNWLKAGPSAFGHQIADGDWSMAGGERSYPPGTVLIIDPDQPVIPGNRILIRPKNDAQWLVRRYQAPWPLARAKEFTLHANNPGFEPIRVTNLRDWEIGGRVIYSLQPE
jgi:SOS-response transcriptional repressor LexA